MFVVIIFGRIIIKKWYRVFAGLVAVLVLFALAAIKPVHASQNITGVYKELSSDAKQDDGSLRYSYYCLTSNGQIKIATPETGDDNSGYYGDALKGTWKSLGNNKYRLKLHDVYDKDYYTLTATIKNGQLNTGSTKKGVKWEWTADHAKKIKMSTSEFLKMFDAAKKSSLKGIQENGYDTPDNDSNNNSNSQGDNSSSSSDSIDAQERAAAFKNGGRWITDKSDPEYYSDANAYVTYLQIKDGVVNGTTNPDGTETAKGMAENDN